MEHGELWTLDQLVGLVGRALAVGYRGAPNGRVRGVPDRRGIRWYTSIGLVDRPSAMRGRSALYSLRHLLQLVAIKRRQAAGCSLAQIQQELSGATDTTLRRIAQLPPGLLTRPDAAGGARAAQTPSTVPGGGAPRPEPGGIDTEVRFWAGPAQHDGAPRWPTVAALTDPPGAAAVSAASAAPLAERAADGHAASAGAEPTVDTGSADDSVRGLRLPGGLTLLLPPGAPEPTPADRAAASSAAKPLVETLVERRLLPPARPTPHTWEERDDSARHQDR